MNHAFETSDARCAFAAANPTSGASLMRASARRYDREYAAQNMMIMPQQRRRAIAAGARYAARRGSGARFVLMRDATRGAL